MFGSVLLIARMLNIIVPEAFEMIGGGFYGCAVFSRDFFAFTSAAAYDSTNLCILKQTYKLIGEGEFTLYHNCGILKFIYVNKHILCHFFNIFSGSCWRNIVPGISSTAMCI